MNRENIKHLIFDLGGVIINLDTTLTIKSFASLTGKSEEYIADFSTSHPIFHQYEKGEVSNEEFRKVIRSITEKELSDESIDHAWNAMILDLPKERILLLESLKKYFDIYLLSNTNTIHMRRVNELRLEGNITEFDQLFNKDYYSHIMGKRKPDSNVFEQVIDENDLDPQNSLFLDDNFSNIEGATRVGLQTLHVTSPQLMMDYFNGRKN